MTAQMQGLQIQLDELTSEVNRISSGKADFQQLHDLSTDVDKLTAYFVNIKNTPSDLNLDLVRKTDRLVDEISNTEKKDKLVELNMNMQNQYGFAKEKTTSHADKITSTRSPTDISEDIETLKELLANLMATKADMGVVSALRDKVDLMILNLESNNENKSDMIHNADDAEGFDFSGREEPFW